MFRARDLSVKVLAGEEAVAPLLACNVCNSTPGFPTTNTATGGLFACNVCDSTPGLPIPMTTTGAQDVEIQNSLQLLRQQLRHELAHLN